MLYSWFQLEEQNDIAVIALDVLHDHVHHLTSSLSRSFDVPSLCSSITLQLSILSLHHVGLISRQTHQLLLL